MLVLGLETSSLAGSVALLEDGGLVGELPLPPGLRSAQSLLPTIDALVQQTGRQLADVRLIGVTIGPGSFTGLRVGTTAAKTLAYALQADALGIDTLDVISRQSPSHPSHQPEAPAREKDVASSKRVETEQSPSHEPRLHVVLDAQRHEFFAATFRGTAAGWEREAPTAIVPVETWLASLQPGDLATGPGLKRIENRLPSTVRAVAAELRDPRASTVALLALEAHQTGRRDNFWILAPAYYRPSAAEEKVRKT